jgi:cation diffusion facilitator CzcD-associated flavoprotein CzcO
MTSSFSGNSPESYGYEYDVIVVGAGIAGINTAYRIQTSLPGVKFTILEARDNIGGTWDLFQYPGVRSDASMYAYGFEWHPWTSENPIGTGEQIRKYLADAVSKYGIGNNIRFGHRVATADWSTEGGMRWTLSVDVDDKGKEGKETKTFTARWIL